MDCSLQLEDYLHSLHCELWNLGQLEPAEFVARAEALAGSEAEPRVIAMIKQGIHQYANERNIMKYVYILDKLLKHPDYSFFLQNYIAQLYADVFASLLTQKCSKEIEELKILRKFWVGCVHPTVMRNIRQTIFMLTNIDIDVGFKPEVAAGIRAYYRDRLCLSPEEIAYHLPQSTRAGLAHVQKIRIEQQRIIQQRLLDQQQMVQQRMMQQMMMEQMMMEQQMMQQQQLPQRNYAIEGQFDNSYKRKRLHSEETKPNGVEEQPQQGKPRKQVHLSTPHSTPHSNPHMLLQQLSQLHPWKCRECGMSFMTGSRYQVHCNDHLKERLSRLDRNPKRGKRGMSLSVAEWKQEVGQGNVQVGQYCIQLAVNSNEQYHCLFCQEPFEVLFRGNQWVLTNGVRTEGNAFLHRTCQLAL